MKFTWRGFLTHTASAALGYLSQFIPEIIKLLGAQ